MIAAGKAGTVKWVKRINASKYQVRYATCKNTKNTKTVNVAKKYTSKNSRNVCMRSRGCLRSCSAQMKKGKAYYV